MKLSTGDMLAILRRFSIADDTNVPRHIDQVIKSNPSAINQLVRFRFRRKHYFILIDDTAEDRESYIMDQIYTAKPDVTGVLLENPTSDLTTFGLPFKGKDVYLFEQVSDKTRLDVLLSTRYPEKSRSTWQKYIKAGYVAVNSTIVQQPKQEVTDADHLAISLPDATDYSHTELPIIFLDDDVIVVNKPAGVLTHSKGEMNDEFTVAEFFRRYTTVGLDTNRPGIVHRLDRDTSGVIIGARTPEAFELLKHQFSDRIAKKTYLAIVSGAPKRPMATIDIPIGRNPSAPSTFRVDSKGRPAVTQYSVLETHDDVSLLALKPRTGRTHQLRVHLAHLGTPMLGDRVYGKSGERLYLHAYRLEITTHAGERRTFTAPVPDSFANYFPEVYTDAATL